MHVIFVIEVSVRDSGIGIPVENQSKLFAPFVQADSSTTRKFGGTGLGLILSKHLAEALGGSVFLLSSLENMGSTFCFKFSVSVSEKTEFKSYFNTKLNDLNSFAPAQPSNELNKMKVLLVEDSTDNQFLFVRYLTKAGALVDVASDGLEGVEKAQQANYDAILMDVQMPKLDGYGATKKLREIGIKTPIIALTAHALKEEKERALSSGFSGYLIKPLDPKLLIQSLSDCRNE